MERTYIRNERGQSLVVTRGTTPQCTSGSAFRQGSTALSLYFRTS